MEGREVVRERQAERAAKERLATCIRKTQEERREGMERVRERMRLAYARQGRLDFG